MRLDKLLCDYAYGSRKEVQRLIRAGQASVNGAPVTDPGSACGYADVVLVNGAAVPLRAEHHVMLHKPAGLLTAARDKKQPTVMSLLPAYYAARGCMPVGRLDKDTTGLLLLSTDGELGHLLLSPKRHVAKTYRCTVDGPLTANDAAVFERGLKLSDFQAQPARLEIVHSAPDESEGLLTIHEGKFHQVKRMFEAVGLTVTALHRQTFGPLTLDPALAPGEYRELTAQEADSLYSLFGKEPEHG